MNKSQKYNGIGNGKELQAVILFADIMDASEISNNTTIKEYIGVVRQFRKCAERACTSIKLNPNENEKIELAVKGDEVCFVLHTLSSEDRNKGRKETEESLKRDVRDAIRFAIAMKLLWRSSEYNQERVKQDLFPRDLGIGIHQGPVYFCQNDDIFSSNNAKSSEGYSLNLAKRIETESRNGAKSRILVSGSVKYWSEKLKIPVEYMEHKPKDRLKGISTHYSLYEITQVKNDFYDFISDLIKELKFDRDIWNKYKLLKEKNPDDFWTELLLRFKTIPREGQIPPSVPKEQLRQLYERDYYLVEAEKFYKIGNYDEALNYCEKVIELNPEDALAYHFSGLIYANKEEHIRSIENFTKAIKLNPNDSYAYSNRGVGYDKKGEHDKAIEDFNHAIELNSAESTFFLNRGVAYLHKGEHDKAIEDFNRAIELNPEDAAAFNNRGVAYNRQGEHDEAIEDLNRAVELNLEYVSAYNNRGASYDKKGEHDKAIENYSRAIALNPEYADAYCNLGLAYSNKDEYDKAIQHFDTAIKLKPGFFVAYNNRGITYAKKGDLSKAVQDYDSAIKFNPTDTWAYINRGYAYFDLQKYSEAKEDFSKVLDIDKHFKDAHAGLGITYYKMEEIEKAKESYRKAIELDSKYDGKWDELEKEGHYYSEIQQKAMKALLNEIWK